MTRAWTSEFGAYRCHTWLTPKIGWSTLWDPHHEDPLGQEKVVPRQGMLHEPILAGPWSNGSMQSKLAAFYLNLCSCSSMMLDVLASCCMLLNKSQPVPSGCPWEKNGLSMGLCQDDRRRQVGSFWQRHLVHQTWLQSARGRCLCMALATDHTRFFILFKGIFFLSVVEA